MRPHKEWMIHIEIMEQGGDGLVGFIRRRPGISGMAVQISWGLGWDHVSVSWPSKVPTWGQMCAVKDLFFGEAEAVMQLHPPSAVYVDDCPTCLHLWKPQEQDIPMPPPEFVGRPIRV